MAEEETCKCETCHEAADHNYVSRKLLKIIKHETKMLIATRIQGGLKGVKAEFFETEFF